MARFTHKRVNDILNRMNKLKAAADEYKELDKEFKELIEEKDSFSTDKFAVKVITYTTTAYNVPEHIKKQYAHPVQRRKVTWGKL